ncbi:MAG: MotA/TolQ/ExbB proton channel family protein [Nitrospiria bacterium]
MHPILAASVIALAITLERCWYFWRIRSRDIARRFEQIEGFLLRGDDKDAKRVAKDTAGPLGKVLQLGLEDHDEVLEILQERMMICGEEVSREAGKGLSLLALIPSVSTMLGLLGTVVGMVSAFQRVAQMEGRVSPALLASGIWVALITTVAGLLVAIPTLIAHHTLQARLTRLSFEIEHYGSRLLLLLKKNGRGMKPSKT